MAIAGHRITQAMTHQSRTLGQPCPGMSSKTVMLEFPTSRRGHSGGARFQMANGIWLGWRLPMAGSPGCPPKGPAPWGLKGLRLLKLNQLLLGVGFYFVQQLFCKTASKTSPHLKESQRQTVIMEPKTDRHHEVKDRQSVLFTKWQCNEANWNLKTASYSNEKKSAYENNNKLKNSYIQKKFLKTTSTSARK